MQPPSLTSDGCRSRQAELAASMQQLQLDMLVLTRAETINWLTGVYLGPLFAPTAAMNRDGKVTLALPQRKLEAPATVDQLVGYEAKWHSTMRNDQRQASIVALLGEVGEVGHALGGEFSVFPQQFDPSGQFEWTDVEPELFRLRRKKHEDELAMLAYANQANEAMYRCAREIIEPGVNEIDVFNALQSTAVDELGEPLTYIGQDFRCAARGGPPRDREARAGELYILDLGVGYRGYYSDNARTIAVDGEPTDRQFAAHTKLLEVFPLIERLIRPGVDCRTVFKEVQAFLDEASLGAFNHHLGHGVGLAPHEGPHLNPFWDDTFEVGDFFTAEPGLYADELNAGIRLEQNYLVTETGVELLTDWPLDLC